MSSADPLDFTATLEEYLLQAESLLGALKSGDESAEWRFKWNWGSALTTALAFGYLGTAETNAICQCPRMISGA